MKKLLHQLLLVCLLVLYYQDVSAQEKKVVSGTIKDSNGVPVMAATIKEKGSSNGVVSDEKGDFRISVKTNAVLVISSIGLKTQEVKTDNSGVTNVQMQTSANELEGVVVTALGISKQKRQLGYSVTEIKGTDMAKTNEANPINALQGKIAGVQIDQGAGGAFGSSKILIRGNSTLGKNNQPIFVIDGVIMDNDTFGGTGRDFGNDLKNLNMEDFESVSVLKGSSAAALYGSKAINGVILITSKKGKQRKGIGVSIVRSLSITDPYAGPDFQNEFGGGTVGDFFTDSRDPNYKPTERWTTQVFPTDPISGLPYIDRQVNRELENWGPRMLGQEVVNYDGTMTRYLPQKNNFLDAFQTGIGHNTNISFDGGTEKSTFRLSLNNNEAEGVVSNNKFTKNSAELRVTHSLTDKISVDAGFAYSSFNGKNPPKLGGGDAFASYNFGKLFSWMLPRNYDTNYWMQKDKYISALGGAPNPNNPNETNKSPEARFWYSLYENEFLQKESLYRGRVALTMKFTDWVKLVVEGNFNNIYTKSETKEKGEGIGFSGGRYGLGFQNKGNNLLKAMLMFDKNISDDFTFNGYVGAESQNYNTDWEYSETRGGLNYVNNFFLANSINQPYTEGGVRSKKKINSFYVSTDFGYKNMLFLQATWRGDYSSALTYTNGGGNNFYNYPAASLSWVFTETFKKMPSWISFGKLRTNYSLLGSDTDPFKVNPGYSFNSYNTANGSNPTSTFSSSASIQPNLKPAIKTSKELGIEMRFLKNRAGFDVSLYQDNTRNQVLDISKPIESGISAQTINAGNIQNKGIEVRLDGTPFKTDNFSWNTALTYSKNQNLIVDLYPGIQEYNLGADIGETSTWAVVGKSYGVIRTQIHSEAYQAKDVNGANIDNPNNGKPLLNWRGDARTAFPGRSNRWQDVGDINAKFRGGWDNTLTYKNLTLNVLIDAKVGGDFVALSYRYGTHTGVFTNTLEGRDASHNGITWTSKYDNITYDDGLIPDGVFKPGQMVTQADGTVVNVGGMSFKEAYDKGFVEPSHAPQYYYRYGSSSTGVSDYWVVKNTWVSLRQVSLSYNFPKSIYEKLKMNNLSFSAIGRDLFYIYNSLPANLNPASNNSNNTAYSGEQGFLPMMRTITFSLRASF